MRILLISSADPTVGPASLVSTAKRMLEDAGHQVVIYTKYPVVGHPEIRYILPPETYFQSVVRRTKDYFLNHIQKNTYMFFYSKETKPPVNSDLVVSRIEGEYDMVHIYFIHNLLSFQTIKKLHDKYPVPFIFSCVDNWPFTGGCHFTNGCTRYEMGCGKCPGMRSPFLNDFTRFNAAYRRAVVDEIKPVFPCNSATEDCYHKSVVTKGHLIVKSIGASLDEEFFKPMDKQNLRRKYEIPERYTRLMMFGCQNLADKRKGMDLLVKSLCLAYDKVPDDIRKSTLLILVGKHDDRLSDNLPFDFKELGFVNLSILAELYAMADIYLSPSVIDPGPIMVNQALMCGTPVVAFDIGTAQDVVKGRGTGYCAVPGDFEDFAVGILNHLLMPDEQLRKISMRCRKFSLECSTLKHKAEMEMELYKLSVGRD